MTIRQRRRLAGAIATLIIAVLVALAQGLPELAQQTAAPLDQVKGAQPGLVRVVRVSDGDTFDVQLEGRKQRVRMIGVDTPETKDPRRPVQCFGEAASRYTKERLLDKEVRLAVDPQGDERDKYDRLLRYVYLPDGTLYNAELIREGYAFAYTRFPYSKLDDFRRLEREARDAGRGLWAGCEVTEENDRRQTESEGR